jgi:hypothetical protein
MFYTHHFAHPETLTRARSWLTHLGLEPHQIRTWTDGVPCLAVQAKPHQLHAVRMLINAAENADPDGFPSFWDTARMTHPHPCPDSPPHAEPRPARTTIAWHPEFVGLSLDHEVEDLRAVFAHLGSGRSERFPDFRNSCRP